MARRVLLLIFVLTLAVAASATRIQISEPPPCSADNLHGSTPVFSLTNGFSIVPVGAGTKLDFCNLTKKDWDNLLLVIDETKSPHPLTASQVICGSDIFATCEVVPDSSNPDILFAFWSGVASPVTFGNFHFPGFPGVPNGTIFSVNLACSALLPCGNTPPTWPGGITITGSVLTPTPEPTSMILLGSGIAAGLFRRKYKK